MYFKESLSPPIKKTPHWYGVLYIKSLKTDHQQHLIKNIILIPDFFFSSFYRNQFPFYRHQYFTKQSCYQLYSIR